MYFSNIRPFILLLPFLLLASAVYAADDMGYLLVTSQPKYAMIYLNSEFTSSLTPTTTLLSVKPGKYRIELAKSGYKLSQDQITVESGKVLEINVVLASLDSKEDSRTDNMKYVEAYVTVRSNPSEAEAYLDDEYIGKTPILEHAVQAGPPKDRKLRIEKVGYKTHEQTISWVNMRDSIKIYISAELKPADRIVNPVSNVKPPKGKGFNFEVNTPIIALFAVLVILIAILIVRIMLRRRAGND